MSQPPLNNLDARYWDDLIDDFDFTPEEKLEIREGADRMIAELPARRQAMRAASALAERIPSAFALSAAQPELPDRFHRRGVAAVC